MIDQEWFYVESRRPTHPQATPTFEIKTAKVIGETPRKWILRESEEIERLAAHNADSDYLPRNVAPGDSVYDWRVDKKGEARREGKSTGKRKTHTKIFTTHRHIAEIMIKERQEAIWAGAHAYKIAQHIQYTIAKDPALLRKVAELIGYEEEGT
jgi:hypothetical protein